jgi:hypothetical protein
MSNALWLLGGYGDTLHHAVWRAQVGMMEHGAGGKAANR